MDPNTLSPERLFPLLAMLIATVISTRLLVDPIRRGHITWVRDGTFIVFAFTVLIYMHYVPTLNAVFPRSAFAFPNEIARNVRVIRFTPEDIQLYAALQTATTILFFWPMIAIYRRIRTGEERLVPLVRVTVQPRRVFGLVAFASVFGMLFLQQGLTNGLLSPYGVNAILLVDLPRPTFFIVRTFQVSGPFLTIASVLGLIGAFGSGARSRWGLLAMTMPFFLAELVTLLNSRFFLLSTVVLVVAAIPVRYPMLVPSLRRLSRTLLPGLVLTVVLITALIPTVRGVISNVGGESGRGVDEAIQLSESARGDGNAGDFPLDWGMRLDGIELMVDATPKLSQTGVLLGERLLFDLAAPILPAFPELNERLKVSGEADSKLQYMQRYTKIETPDYTSVSLTELYVNFWVFAFPLAGLFFGTVQAKAAQAIRQGIDSRLAMVGVFATAVTFVFEWPMTAQMTGWLRALPVLLVLLVLDPLRPEGSGAAKDEE